MAKSSGKKYEIEITNAAKEDLEKLGKDKKLLTRIMKKIESLQFDPRPPNSKQLSNSNNHRVRVGDYRIIYNIDDSKVVVAVARAGHRRDVYDH